MLGCGPRRERPLPDMSHFPTTEARRADPAAQSLGVSHHSSGPGPGPLLQHPAPLPDHQPRPRSPLAVGREQRAGLFEAVAGEQQPLDVRTVLGPQLHLEEVPPVSNQGIVGVFLEEVVRRSRRLAQPASRNGSLLGSKRDRKIAASIGSSKQ